MKVGQKTIVRWLSKQVAQRSDAAPRRAVGLRELDVEQLRHVSGGRGASMQSPFKGW